MQGSGKVYSAGGAVETFARAPEGAAIGGDYAMDGPSGSTRVTVTINPDESVAVIVSRDGVTIEEAHAGAR